MRGQVKLLGLQWGYMALTMTITPPPGASGRSANKQAPQAVAHPAQLSQPLTALYLKVAPSGTNARLTVPAMR